MGTSEREKARSPRRVARASRTSATCHCQLSAGEETLTSLGERNRASHRCRNGRRALILLRHKLRRERPFILRRERRFDLAPQHGQRDRISTSLATSRRRMVAMEFGTCRSGRSGGSSGSVTFGKGKLREENFGNRS